MLGGVSSLCGGLTPDRESVDVLLSCLSLYAYTEGGDSMELMNVVVQLIGTACRVISAVCSIVNLTHNKKK